MKNKAISKDFIVEIRKSLSRFLSILLIVALGVAFFAGIRSAKPDMQLSADAFYDSSKLMDIRILSTLGLTDYDVEAIRNVEGVDEVEPAFSLDALCDTDSSQFVVKVMSKTEKLNLINIKEGRLPKDSTECLVDSQFIEHTGYKIGDSISLHLEDRDNIRDNLSNNQFKITGIGSTSYYLSLDRGSSALGNGNINSFIVLTPDTFLDEAYTEIYASVENSRDYISYSEEYDKRIETVVNKIKEIADARKEARYVEILEEPQSKIKDAKAELQEEEINAKEELAKAKQKIDDAKVKLSNGEKAIADGKEELKKARVELEKNKISIQSSQKEVDEGFKELISAENALKAGKEKLEKQKQQLEEQKKQLQEQAELLQEQTEQLQEPSDQSQEQAEEEQESAKQSQEQAEEEQNETLSGFEQDKLDEAYELLLIEEQKIKATEEMLSQNRIKLQQSQDKIDAAWKNIKQGEAELAKNQALLEEKENEINASKKKLADSEKQYKDAVITTNTKLTDAKQEIADAEEELAKIKYPKWYVLDRSSIQTYVEYGQDTDRIGNIGEVFPAIFFLVAALVSLTTMTRMVEEQRVQIGTLKALGYSKITIAGKYMLYALLASLSGSIIGILIGEKVLPIVIITAYRILYHNLPKVIAPYNFNYSILSILIAIFTTTFATLFATYKETMASPSQLMRPASPKMGKRVLLERIPWLWKNFNFTTKSTIRNLLRYKKRFFMTVFGIGGCMALLLVGFGLKDSISAISDIQYVDLMLQDATIAMDNESSENEITDLYNYLNKNDKVEDSIMVKQTTIDAFHGKSKKSTNILVPEDSEHLKEYFVFRNRLTKEEYNLQEGSVIIDEKLASLLHVKVGDSITLSEDETKQMNVKISSIIENYMMHYVIMSPETYQTLYGNAPEYNRIFLKYSELSEIEEDTIASELLELPAVTSVIFTTDLQGQIEDMLKSLNTVVYVLIIAAGLLAFVVLYNLNNINITERQRELATLKVLGFQDMEVATYVYRENVILTIIGAILGVFLGIILHRYVILTAEIDMIMFGRTIKLVSYLYSMLLTIGFSAFVNFVMYYKLRRIDMVESLKSIE